MNLIFSFIFKLLIRLYQRLISPFFPAKCRYIPTCSEYGIKAINKYGPWKGCYLVLKRIFRCHPFGGQGFDPVP